MVHRQPVEIWAGIEGTVNRVGDRYFDQMSRNGHDQRLSDLDLIGDLGVKRVRYPVLWERTAPGRIADADWSWPDARLARLRSLGVDPIVGLLHHGSGPPHTSLVDPDFPEKLAEYAGAVARRYPWVRYWTPVNEPLTTARFSGLYGHWYPHGRDDRTFMRALLNQCTAISLAMQAIREANPDAQLVQTEDLGKTHSTPLLRGQATYENERRWLSLDLLCGRVDPDHPLWARGIFESFMREIDWLSRNACPPDILGVNHYLTSERFLDEELERYPAGFHGGNGELQYADVEAVRVAGVELSGFAGLLSEAWDRYGLPVAVTECHLGCTRDEQLRWLVGTWDAACALRRRGVDLVAVTAWSLFGSFDWHCLAVRDDGYYEPGVFDCRGREPRPTALAAAVKSLAAGIRPDHPALASPGWWELPSRFHYFPVPVEQAG